MYGYITQLLIERMGNYDERLDSGRNLYIIYEVFTVYYRYHQLARQLPTGYQRLTKCKSTRFCLLIFSWLLHSSHRS